GCDEDRLAAHVVAAREPLERGLLLQVVQRGFEVDALGIEVAARDVGDAGDDRTPLGEETGGPRADVAEALDDDPLALKGVADGLEQVLTREEDAAAGRRVTPDRATELDRLAGDDARRVAAILRVLIE